MKRPNATIGMVRCGICQELGAVRKDRAGRLYYVCACGGPHPLHGERGQDYVLRHGEIWGESGQAPDDAPEWIRRGLGFPPGTRSPASRPRVPAPVPAPAADPVPPRDDPAEPGDEDERFSGGLFL